MTNFDFLKQERQFASFADVAAKSENLLHIDIDSCVLNCRRAMEFAVKWMYSVDGSLEMPYQDNLNTLMGESDFREIVGAELWQRMDLIRKLGNRAAHSGRKITEDEAELCLENLFIFLDFVAYCYAEHYEEQHFDRSLLTLTAEEALSFVPENDIDLGKLIEENKALKEELTARRENQQQTYVPKPLDLSEYKTRKIYIDAMLADAGWTEGTDWLNEFAVTGMPDASGTGYADYVLLGNDGRPLALVEAKRACADLARGRQQAKLYADCLERQYGRRPVIFLTNGFETHIDDGVYPERPCAFIYSRRDLEKLFNLRRIKTSLANISVNKKIAGRYYQEAAVKAVCASLSANRRKALLVMATGSGKTRTVISLCDVLMQHGWVRNILFLADRSSLVTQAKRSFVNLLDNLSTVNLCEEKDNYAARCVFSTYQTMYNAIDSARDDNGKLFTCGHFDLVICDEAHRSVYNKYREIFNYFDAPLVGLTATPKDEIDKNTYNIFDLAGGSPTYAYELSQAVKDGYLVNYTSVETKLKFIEEGIVYDELSDEEKEHYEKTFRDENGEWPEMIGSSALNSWLFNEDTIVQVLDVLMEHGYKTSYGSKIGKTVIFAKNHNHAEKILEIFNQQYPHLPGYAAVIDNYLAFAQSAIDDFSDPEKLPQIAISVDMLDTGIDVPEILNLVFFKKVMSKAKFWQMIGRGTRLCPGLMDGEDKTDFRIFDFCGNFAFFRVNENGSETASALSVQGELFGLKAQIAQKLQDAAYQTEPLISLREALVSDLLYKVRELNRDNFAVKQHLRYTEKYSVPESFAALTYPETEMMKTELAPLIQPYDDDPKALRFDALMYGIELCALTGKPRGRAVSFLKKTAAALSGLANIREIQIRQELIGSIVHNDAAETDDLTALEYIRSELRGLIKYLTHETGLKNINFKDDILSMEWNGAELESSDLSNYRAKAEYYIRQHQDNAAIAKLKGNVPLTPDDISQLERILWSEVGTREAYTAEYGQKPLGELVRETVGLDMNAAKEAFSEYLGSASLDARQIYFVNQIIEYIVRNGMMKDLSVLREPPFSDRGSIVEIFTDLSVWAGIRAVIEKINQNAA